MVTNQTTKKLNMDPDVSATPIQKVRDLLSVAAGYGTKAFLNISFENLFMVVVISMLLMSTATTAFIMGKDAERNISVKAADSIVTTITPATSFCDTGLKATLEVLKLDRAPTVVGLKEDDAVTKLKKAKVESEKITVAREKMTYPALVAKSDTLFFGEVQSQKVSTKGISLTIVEADLEDPFTAEMNAMGSRLAWPVPGNERISSHFGGRKSPGGIGSTNHQGIDIPAPTGKPIIAVKAGKVESAGRMGGYGNCVVVDHENGFKSLYGHMSQITCNSGDRVEPGDIIGKVGSTGWSTGPHLHFGLIKNGTYIDPEPFFTGKENVSAGSEVSTNTTGLDEALEKEKESTAPSTEATDPDGDKAGTKPEEETTGSEGSNKDNGSEDNNTGGNKDSGSGNNNSGGNTPANKPTVNNNTGDNTGSNTGGNTGGDSGGNQPTTQPSNPSGGTGGDSGGGDSGGNDGGDSGSNQPTTQPSNPSGGNSGDSGGDQSTP